MEDKIRVWLSAPEFARDLEVVRDYREYGTTEWFFKVQLFKQWLHMGTNENAMNKNSHVVTTRFRKNTLWVHGESISMFKPTST